MNFSLEISPKTEIENVPPISDIYITMLPGGDYKETANKAVELVKKGFNPVPHFPARSMQDEKELKEKIIISCVGLKLSNCVFKYSSCSYGCSLM